MKKLFVLIAAACMTCTAAFAQTVKPFKEGEREQCSWEIV